jgi:hypothetical protein
MHLLIVSLLSLTTFFVNPPQQQPEWTAYSSAEGQFSAAMPDEPRTNMIVTESAKGLVYTHTVSANDKDLNEYLVSWTNYDQSVAGRGTGKTFDRVRDALISSKGGKLLTESAISMMGRPARAVIFTDSDGRVVRARFYFIGKRFYQVMTQSASKQDSASSDRFFQSFKVRGS